MTFYERYEQCCQQKGIKPASQETADKLGCTKSNISHLAKAGQTPRGDLVAKFAVMLNISADYLLGLTETPYPLMKDMELEQNELKMLDLFRNLNKEGQDAALAMLSGFAGQDIYKKGALDEKKEA